jgi:hypothetical protein
MLWRTLNEIGPAERNRIGWAWAKVRAHVWGLICDRHGQIPPAPVADKDLGATVVIRMDASILIAHSDKELAAGTFKHTWGHHLLTAWCDNTGESLAFGLRAGNAGSNTASEHIEVLDEAITQIPARHRRDLLVTLDGAGAPLPVGYISALNAAPGRRVHYLVGFDPGRARPDRDRPGTRDSLAGGV